MAGEPERVARDYFGALARADAEGDGGRSHLDFSKRAVPARWRLPLARGDVGAQLERVR